MNGDSFANENAGNTAPYNLAEIWQFPMNGGSGLGESGGGLGLRRPQFAHGSGPFGDFLGPNPDVPGNDPINSEQRESNQGVNRKRSHAEEDLAAKGVSTSNGGGNGVVFTL